MEIWPLGLHPSCSPQTVTEADITGGLSFLKGEVPAELLVQESI